MLHLWYQGAAPLVQGCCSFGHFSICLLTLFFDRERSCLLNAYRPMPFAKGTSLMKRSCAYFALSGCRFYRKQKKNLSFFFFYAPTYDFIP